MVYLKFSSQTLNPKCKGRALAQSDGHAARCDRWHAVLGHISAIPLQHKNRPCAHRHAVSHNHKFAQ